MPDDLSPPIGVLRPSSGGGARLDELFELAATSDAVVRGVTLDSRLVRPGDLYVALPGRHDHGARFAAAAAAAGAAAVLTDPVGSELAGSPGVPVVVVEQPRQVMATTAARVYGEPATALQMFAVTGTNGKTTTTYLLEAALRAAGVRTGLVGTIGFRLDGRPLPSVRTTVTTPESPELQGLLGYLRANGATAVLMEVSSHALVLGRVDAICFDVSAFTNFGRDHLDFHGDVDSYFAAKAALFSPERTRRAVINIDDDRGRQLVDRLAGGPVVVRTVSLHDPADVYAESVGRTADGRTEVRAQVGGRPLTFGLGLPGDFNVRNALTALAMIEAAALPAVDLAAAAGGLADAVVPGRMQRVDLGPGGPAVYVDFAHTPQAVTAALTAMGDSRRVVVLGCGGDRDPDKRRPMGVAAATVADVVLVTDDNPRSEDPVAIRAEVLAGARAAARERDSPVVVEDAGDRASAIRRALTLAGPGDAVAILGKGHESGQEIAGQVLPFDDAAVVAEQWADLSRPRGGS